jgi:hypothetical protein
MNPASIKLSNTSANINEPNQTVQLFFPIDYADNTIRSASVIVHLLYFVSITFLKEFQSKNIFFLHHVNLVSLLFCLHYAFYINSKFPNFDSPVVNDVLCKMSEFTWIMLNFLRMYSLLALAIYRYIAVHHIQLFRKIKLFWILMMIGSSWIVSMVLSLLLKFSLSTTYSKWYCTDGFNEDINMTIVYYVLRTLLGTVLPSFTILYLYKKILFKVKVTADSTRLAKPALQNNNLAQVLEIFTIRPQREGNILDIETYRRMSVQTNRVHKFIHHLSKCIPKTTPKSVNRSISTLNRTKRHSYFARQILLVNLIVIFASVFSDLVSLNLVLISYSSEFCLYTKLLDMRYILRIIFLLIQCGIPIVSWMLYPGTFHVVLSKNWLIAKFEKIFLFVLLLIRNPE